MTVVVEDVAVTVVFNCWLVADSVMVPNVALSGYDCLADDGAEVTSSVGANKRYCGVIIE
ncbi:hypothetical protein DPMN_135286 [Dreissena polymorpha]|uniref:Uncharacterized protein n=1 Tax=Dreissena polymorpha TaxID=45954 RepID=A0A9D4FYW7_DREPO|nr:hypothetical protein DPMN_135286 [Dreissena polymorpha]